MNGATLIRAGALPASRWKNGGGTTREIAVFPPGSGLDDFVWRVSLADVEQAGPFSRFDGVDRTLVLLAGAGMLLDEQTGARHRLEHAFDRLDFAGETAIEARLIAGATRDFNLMWRRDAAHGRVDRWRGQARHVLDGDVVLLFCPGSSIDVQLDDAAPVTLMALDTLRIDGARGRHCHLSGAGTVLAITLRLVPAGQNQPGHRDAAVREEQRHTPAGTPCLPPERPGD